MHLCASLTCNTCDTAAGKNMTLLYKSWVSSGLVKVRNLKFINGVLDEQFIYNTVRNKANILAEVVGYGVTGDAYHITSPAPRGEGGARVMKAAMDMAEIKPSQVAYINAHGTSTRLNDQFESEAIMDVSVLASKIYQFHQPKELPVIV